MVSVEYVQPLSVTPVGTELVGGGYVGFTIGGGGGGEVEKEEVEDEERWWWLR